MKIILKENIENLGSKGDIVNVAAGYGRNYLLPKKLALEVTPSNKKMIEMEQAALKKNLEKTRMSYQDVIQKLNELSFSFERKTGEKDTIFGSVSAIDIKEELDKLGFEIEKKKILLKEPIKRLGNYTVGIKVFLEDTAEIKVQVVPEGGEKKDEKPDLDKEEAKPQEKKAAEKREEKKEEETETTAETAPQEDTEESPAAVTKEEAVVEMSGTSGDKDEMEEEKKEAEPESTTEPKPEAGPELDAVTNEEQAEEKRDEAEDSAESARDVEKDKSDEKNKTSS